MISIEKREGETEGEARGEAKGMLLMQQLFALGRNEDAKRAASDQDFRNTLFKEFNIL